jgi:hypothetical protein
MPDAGQRAITAIPTLYVLKKKQFHKKFLCDTTFSFTKTHLCILYQKNGQIGAFLQKFCEKKEKNRLTDPHPPCGKLLFFSF